MIARRRQSALCTLMPALAERFADLYATETGLARPARIDFHHLDTSFCRFVVQFVDERRPSCVIDGLRQHAAGQSLDVQVFHGNHAIGVDQTPCRFVLKVRSLILHMHVSFLQKQHGFPAVVPPAFASSDPPLCDAQSGLCLTVVARVGNRLASREGSKDCQPHINPDTGLACRDAICTILNTEAYEPLACLPLHGDGFDVALDWPMQFDFDVPDTLQIQPGLRQSAAIAIAGEGVAVKAPAGFETGIPGFLPMLDAAKEGFEGLVNAAQDILTG